MIHQPAKPRYREFFVKDLRNNLERFPIDASSPNSKVTLEKECMMYSYDMCILFHKKSGGFLPLDWIEHIVNEVGCAISSLYPHIFGDKEIQKSILTVKQNLQLWPHEAIQMEVDKYYNRI